MEQNNKYKHTALLIMDVQGATVKMLKDETNYISSINKSIKHARANNIPVLFVVIGFRKGYPEVSANNKSSTMLKAMPGMGLDTEEGTKVHPSVAIFPEDIIITKKRVSAFSGSDLEVVLRGLDIKHLILTGIATSGVVLSTLREAADKDYMLTVLSDCCADRDDEVHHILTAKVFVRQASVITSDEWCSANN